MTTWRPRSSIRVVAIGLHWRDGHLLAGEVRDDAGRLKGVRPLGGGVNFGERWQDALVREFQEELGVVATIRGDPLVMENIFSHEGALGHEVVFVGRVVFPDGAFAGQDSVAFHEDNGVPCVARWFDPGELDLDGGPQLYPAGLRSLLWSLRET